MMLGNITQIIFLFHLFCLKGGLILVPLLGKRRTLILGCLIYMASPFLTYFTLETNILGMTFTYGILSASSAIMLVVPLTLIPVTWFPDHRGQVIGIVASGFGFSSLVFVPIQTLLINPSNIEAVTAGPNSSSTYFESAKVLENIPSAFLYMGCLYAFLLFIGIILTVERLGSETKVDKESTMMTKLR